MYLGGEVDASKSNVYRKGHWNKKFGNTEIMVKITGFDRLKMSLFKF